MERTGRELVITDRGRPVARVVPYRPKDPDGLRALRGTLVSYEKPTEPVGEESWDALG